MSDLGQLIILSCDGPSQRLELIETNNKARQSTRKANEQIINYQIIQLPL
jgi:hypothetical protein